MRVCCGGMRVVRVNEQEEARVEDNIEHHQSDA